MSSKYNDNWNYYVAALILGLFFVPLKIWLKSDKGEKNESPTDSNVLLNQKIDSLRKEYDLIFKEFEKTRLSGDLCKTCTQVYALNEIASQAPNKIAGLILLDSTLQKNCSKCVEGNNNAKD